VYVRVARVANPPTLMEILVWASKHEKRAEAGVGRVKSPETGRLETGGLIEFFCPRNWITFFYTLT